MNMEQALITDGVLQFTYRGIAQKIAQFVEKILAEHATEALHEVGSAVTDRAASYL